MRGTTTADEFLHWVKLVVVGVVGVVGTAVGAAVVVFISESIVDCLVSIIRVRFRLSSSFVVELVGLMRAIWFLRERNKREYECILNQRMALRMNDMSAGTISNTIGNMM